jgi:hypothetical protein
LLYEYIEEHEPELFHKIKKLVEAGKWHIMGGWYVQPDCTVPSGEGFVRQIETGLTYFKERFGMRPSVAVNFDSFGHTQGLVQILNKCGYEGYIFCRPLVGMMELPKMLFNWKGLDGSAVKEPKNITAPIGTSVRDIIDFAGGLNSEPGKIIFGGPMTGRTAYSLDEPIVKTTNAITALTIEDSLDRKYTA